MDATDNFPIRFALNAACYAAGLPLVGFVLDSPDGDVSDSDRANLSAFGDLIRAPVLCELPHGETVEPALESALADAVWTALSAGR